MNEMQPKVSMKIAGLLQVSAWMKNLKESTNEELNEFSEAVNKERKKLAGNFTPINGEQLRDEVKKLSKTTQEQLAGYLNLLISNGLQLETTKLPLQTA